MAPPAQHSKRKPPKPIPPLSARETETVALVTSGMTSAEAAPIMGISSRTVEGFVRIAMLKLELRSRVDLTRWAMRNGLTV